MVSLRALLIGIDHYAPNPYCSSLAGAVADVEAVKDYLLRLGVPGSRIRELTSPAAAEGRPPVPRERWPTYENMVAAIRRLGEEAAPGDQILIHYSGHGGRTPTLIPGVKTIDEGLVPADIGDPGARYLRDVELTYLVHEMVQKKLLVTLIFDACHSGGMMRGKGRMTPRGSRKVDETPRPLDSLVASRDKLELTWRRLHARAYATARGRSRSVSGSGWLPTGDRFVLLAACQSVESAYEVPFEGTSRGVLTYCLLEILAEGGRALTFRQIYNRLIGRVHRYAPYQTPVLEGDTSRTIFGGRLRGLLNGINVVAKDAARGRVLLNAGQALGLGKGARLEVRSETSPGDRGDDPVVEIEECGAVTSWAVARGEGAGVSAVQPGDQAVLIDPGTSFRHRVALVATHPALDAVRQKLAKRSSGFLEVAEETAAPSFQVAVSPQGEYEIWHPDGRTVADLSRLPVTARGAAARVVDRLVHLAKFHNVRQLENRDHRSPLHGAVTVELGLLPEGFVPGAELASRPFDPPGSVPEVETGRWVCLCITNNALQSLQIYVLDLQPGWSIEQVHPANGTEVLEGEQQVRLPFAIYLPQEFRNRREILKVFATADPVDFRWLQLLPIDKPPRTARSSLGTPKDALERLFAEIAVDGPRTRHVRPEYASRQWTSAQVEFEVVPGG